MKNLDASPSISLSETPAAKTGGDAGETSQAGGGAVKLHGLRDLMKSVLEMLVC